MVPVSGVHVAFGSHGAEGELDDRGFTRSNSRAEIAAVESDELGRDALKRVEECAGRAGRDQAGRNRPARPAGLPTPIWTGLAREAVRRWLAASDLEGLEILEGHRIARDPSGRAAQGTASCVVVREVPRTRHRVSTDRSSPLETTRRTRTCSARSRRAVSGCGSRARERRIVRRATAGVTGGGRGFSGTAGTPLTAARSASLRASGRRTRT